MKKKFLTIIICAALAFSLTACANSRETTNYSKREGAGEDESSSQKTKYPGIWDVLPKIDVTPESELEYKYSIALDGIIVTNYIGESIRVRIPDTIEGEPVVKIDFSNSNLADSMTITELIVPDSVREMDISAVNFLQIKYTNYPASGKNISYGVWPALETVYIPNGVTEIVKGAFSICPKLVKVTLPDTLTKIGDSAFSATPKLAEINIPESVTEIGESAFRYCPSLTSITIPNGVTEIKDMTFCKCAALAEISIPKNVTNIGLGAFADCTSLRSISIPNGVKRIGISAFENCPSLKRVNIPDSVTEIGEDAFKGCTELIASHKGKTYDYEHINDLYTAING